MRKNLNVIAAYSIMMVLIILVGIFQSWNVALSIFNLCLISAVMTMGANIQWGYAGLINFGIMGNTDLNILKNIYGNFLKNHNILSLLTTFYISFTAQLPENDYTFNNIPFVTAVRDALPQNIDLGLENKAQIIDLLKYKATSGKLSNSNEAFL